MDYCVAATYSLLEIDGKMKFLDAYQVGRIGRFRDR